MNGTTRGFFRTAYGVMLVVLVQYVLKVALKGGFGAMTGSALFTGDGAHNASDIFQALLVVGGIWLSLRPTSRDYPLGFRGIDTFGSLAIGASLLYVAIANVLIPSVTGLASAEAESTLLEGSNGILAVAIMLASAGVSQIVGRFQVRVGRETGHASVEADGQETLGDGRIEALSAFGLAAQAVFQAAWIENVLGIGMACVMMHTAYEILSTARDMLFNRSLGTKVGMEIVDAAMDTCGVEDVGSLVTYRLGTCSVVEVDVMTRLGARGSDLIRTVLTERIREIVQEDDREVRVAVRCVAPAVVHGRYAFLAHREPGSLRIVGNPAMATHLLVCEAPDGRIENRRDASVTPDTLVDVLKAKKVTVLFVADVSDAELESIQDACDPVEVRPSPTALPELMGVPLA